MAPRQMHRAFTPLGIAPRRLMTAPRGGWRMSAAARRHDRAAIQALVERYLIGLRRKGRRAILIADADCGDGRLLIDAAKRAHALGFAVIDALGFDSCPRRLAAATAAAAARGAPAIGFRFALAEQGAPLLLDAGGDEQADLMLAALHTPDAVLIDAIDRDGLLIRHR